jgi:hypothetical protein
VKVRVCVSCGSPGREDKYSCDECGGTIIEAEPPPPLVATGPPLSGSGNWAPPGMVAAPPDAPPVVLEHPLRRHIRMRTNRALVGATVMILCVIVAVVALGVVVTRTWSHKPTPVSKDLRSYAVGVNTASYATKTFVVRLPLGYHKNPVTLRLSHGKTLTFAVASSSDSVTALAVASAPLDARTAKTISGDVQSMATQLAEQMNVGGADYSVQTGTFEGYPAWEITGQAAVGPDVALRVVVYPKEIVVFAAASANNVAGDLKALEATYQRVAT